MHAGLLNETNFNSTHIQEYTLPYFPFPIWRDESMHELLMQMARSVVGVIKEARDPAQPPGNFLRSLIRVDVAVVQQQGLVSHPCTRHTAMHYCCLKLGQDWYPQQMHQSPDCASQSHSTSSFLSAGVSRWPIYIPAQVVCVQLFRRNCS